MTLPERSPVTELAGEPRPYVLRSGDGRAHLLIDQVGRVLVGAEESRGALSYTVLDGPAGGPIPFHFHQAEHDFFFCHRGQVQVWAGEESRVMNVGDFASVPPKVPHAYQLHGHYSGFTGPITPGGWDRFFDFCGLPYAGPGYPVDFQPVLPLDRFFEAQEKFAMTYVPEQPWAPATTAPDDTLPGAHEPYFLRAGAGTRHVAGGQLQTVICGAAESGGAATMVTLELFKGSGLPAHVHERTHEVMFVLDGQLTVTIDGEDQLLSRGDVASIPSGTEHAYASAAHYTKVLASSAPGGLERLLIAAGTPTENHMPSPDDPDPDAGALREVAGDSDVRFV